MNMQEKPVYKEVPVIKEITREVPVPTTVQVMMHVKGTRILFASLSLLGFERIVDNFV